jgi:hypothetical protein
VRIQVDPLSVGDAGAFLESSVSAPLLELSAVVSGVGSALQAAVADPLLSGSVSDFVSAAGLALSNGGIIAGLLGRSLSGGGAAYQGTDAHAMPSCPAPGLPIRG